MASLRIALKRQPTGHKSPEAIHLKTVRGSIMTGYTILVCVLYFTFSFVGVIAQTEYCVTPRNERGSCIPISSCDVLYQLVQQRSVSQQNVDYLRESHCGFDGNNPKVCCPEGKSGQTATARELNMFDIPNWPNQSPRWTHDALDSLLTDAKPQSGHVTLEQLQDNSQKFPIKFPIDSVRCKTLIEIDSKKTLERNINSAYPVLHENALGLYSSFLYYKRKFGSPPERELYAQMSLLQLVQRLLAKRAVVFLGEHDRYLLLDGTTGFGNWESVGTVTEGAKLNISKCLSYAEIKLSALISVSSYTIYINDGNRYNQGVAKRSNVEPEGIIIGLIGARFEKAQVMEYEEVIITEQQNHEANGYGTQFAPTLHSVFSGFYEVACSTYQQAMGLRKSEPTRFNEIRSGVLFDNEVYCKRIALSIDTLLVEANQRAKERQTTAFVHVVGIGLGVWMTSSHQKSLFLDTFSKRIQALGNNLHSVSDVVFAYFSPNATSGGYKDQDLIPISGHPKKGIKIYISKREPHTKLTGEDNGKLLVVSYAWDGNALPGNEFWEASLAASGDPAAAASTQVAELHNPHINPKVCAENLRIVTPAGVVPYLEYCEKVKASN